MNFPKSKVASKVVFESGWRKGSSPLYLSSAWPMV
jgi:hypothetical protein